MSMKILTNKVEVSINNREVPCEWVHDKHARGAEQELGKFAYKETPRWF